MDTRMWKGLFMAGVVYAFGHPALDSYRPAALDVPLHAFHQEMNQAASDSKRALSVLDDARSMRYLQRYTERMTALLKSGS
jgi:hypothetical protein